MSFEYDPADQDLLDLFEEPPLPDNGFSKAVSQRIDGYLRVRKYLSILTLLTYVLMGLQTFRWVSDFLPNLDIGWAMYPFIGLLMGFGVFGAAWIDRENLLSISGVIKSDSSV